jgi:predicted DNA-binding protein
MILRLELAVKNKLNVLAGREGKTTSQVMREMIDQYIRERDISAYIDNLWDRTQHKLTGRGVKPADITAAIRSYRASQK